jgi:hypothetical protein
MASDLGYWLDDAAKILGRNGSTDHADKVREAASTIRAQAAEIEDLTGKLEVAMTIVRGAQAAHDAERQHRTKLREAVEVMRMCADGLESNGEGCGGDVLISEEAFRAACSFLATMERPSD